jgi:hypothetical protein
LYWVIIFIPPIYTQTIVKWVARIDGGIPKPPLYPSPPNPSLKKPMKLNTFFFFFQQILVLTLGSPPEKGQKKKNPWY